MEIQPFVLPIFEEDQLQDPANLTNFDDFDDPDKDKGKGSEDSEDSEKSSDNDLDVTRNIVDVTNSDYVDQAVPDIANLLSEKGLITEVPQGVDPAAFDREAFWKTIEHNMKLREEKAMETAATEQQNLIFNALPPIAQELVELALTQENTTDEDMLEYIEARRFEQIIADLDPESPTQAEEIIRRYYSNQGWGANEITDKLTSLVETNTLTKEAKIIHPKLVSQAQEIVRKKNDDAKLIQQAETRQREFLHKRLVEKLKEGKVYDIPVSVEDARFLIHALMNDEYQVPVKGGKKVTMTYGDAMMYFHKNDPEKGDLERLMLAMLIMKSGPQVILDHYKKKGTTEAVQKQIAENRFSNNRVQTGSGQKPGSSSDSMFKPRIAKK